jgi:hypothetical protein
VCIVSAGQDQWAVAQSSFLLAKLAGADLRFQWSEDALEPADVYLLPGLAGTKPISRRRWSELLARVEAGSTLYVSFDNVVLAGLEVDFGVKVLTRSRRDAPGHFTFKDDARSLPLASAIHLQLEAGRATVLATEPDGNPAFTCCTFGRGCIFLLTTPIESTLATTPGAFQTGPYVDAWRIYARIFDVVTPRRVWRKTSPMIAITEHPQDERRRVVVLINHHPRPVNEPVRLAPGWQLEAILHGQGSVQNGVTLAAGEGVILQLKRT